MVSPELYSRTTVEECVCEWGNRRVLNVNDIWYTVGGTHQANKQHVCKVKH